MCIGLKYMKSTTLMVDFGFFFSFFLMEDIGYCCPSI